MNPLTLILLLVPAAVSAQSSTNFKLEAPSSLPTAQTTDSANFRIEGSLGNVFAQVSTNTCLEVAAGIIPHRLPSNLGGPFIDVDNDGLADGWERFFFGSLLFDGDGDNDGDGSKNSYEQSAATDPMQLASIFRITDIAKTGTTVALEWTGGYSKNYVVEYSQTLIALSWVAIGTATTDATGEAMFSDTDPARTALAKGFYRMKLNRD